MKNILLPLCLLLFICSSFADSSSPTPIQKDQWFLQLAVFNMSKNAIDFQKKIQNKIEHDLALERRWGHFISIHPAADNYRVLAGPYPRKDDAKQAQGELAQIVNNSMLLRLNTNIYYNYQYGYRFRWQLITQREYKELYKKSVVALNVRENGSITNGNRSLISHTKQITQEVFDIVEAKRLLSKSNVILFQDDSESYSINAYALNGKKSPVQWYGFFYAYYPSENLVVFSGEGWSLISLDILSGKWGLKMPYKTLYTLNNVFRITGSDFAEFAYGRYYIEWYNKELGHYVELVDLGIISPWFNDSAIDGLAWLSDNEIIFTEESSQSNTVYYKVSIYRI